jgi:hypothetical protein
MPTVTFVRNGADEGTRRSAGAARVRIETNAYGQPVQTASVVYGRKSADTDLPDPVQDAQARLHAQLTSVDYTAVIDTTDALRLPAAWQTRTEELGVLPPATGSNTRSWRTPPRLRWPLVTRRSSRRAYWPST